VLRFHLDESLSPDIAVGLRRRERDCTSTQEAGLLGMSDTAQLEFATSADRILVTGGQGFLRIAAGEPAHAGIIFCTRPERIGAIVKAIDGLCFERPEDDFRSTVQFLSSDVNHQIAGDHCYSVAGQLVRSWVNLTFEARV